MVTRARAQAESLARRIEELGGEVIEFPTIEIQPPESFAAFDAAIEKIASYDWLIFTSVNSIEPFLSRLRGKGKTVASLTALKIGAIGPETAKRLEESGLRASLVPARYQAEGILDAVAAETMRGRRVLIPRAAEAREVLPNTLRQWGAFVDAVAPVWYPRVFGMRGATVNVALRVEYVDYNVGSFFSTGLPIRDDVFAVVPGVSFRPIAGTVFKANYVRQWSRDLLGNPTARLGGYQFGVATYF